MLSRPYAGEADYGRMRALVAEIYELTGPPVYCTLGEFDWWRFSDPDPRIATHARLWFEPDERLIGFAWPSGQQVDIVVHPGYSAIEDEMLTWAEVHRLAVSQPEAERVTLTAWAFDHDLTRQSVLEQRGYEAAGYHLNYRARPLGAPIAQLSLPSGYALGLQSDDTAAARVATHRDAFGSTKMTVSSYRSSIRAPAYREDLDLVVWAPNGSIAAFALIWFDRANRMGTFEPVGTHSEHRRRGLARILMQEGLRRLQALGAKTACVISGGDEGAANSLYDAVGMPVIARNHAWVKRLK